MSLISHKTVSIFLLILVGLFPTIAHAQINLQEDLISYWSFDGAFLGQDVGGVNVNHGVVTGATQTTGLITQGSAYSFDSNDNITVPNDASLGIEEDFTVSFWMNPEFPEATTSGLGQGLFVKADSYELRITENHIPNGSWEGTVTEWSLSSSGGATGSNEQSTEKFLYGTSSLKQELTGGGGPFAVHNAASDGVSNVSASEGEIWNCSSNLFIESNSGTRAQFYLSWRDSGNSEITFERNLITSPIGEWFSTSLLNKVAPSGTESLVVRLILDDTGTPGGTGLFYWDGVQCTKTPNRVENFSFESVLSGTWTTQVTEGGSSVTQSTDEAYFGTNSLKADMVNSAAGFPNVGAYQDISANPGEIWGFNGRVLFDNRTGVITAKLIVQFRDSAETILLNCGSNSVTPDVAWQILNTTSCTAPALTTHVRVWPRIDGVSSGGDSALAYFDGIIAYRKSNGTLDSLELTLPGVTGSPFYSQILSEQYEDPSLYTITRNKTSGDILFYQDFTLIDTINGGAEALAIDTDDLIFGNDTSGDSGFIGILDEIKLWERILSAEEILFAFSENPSASSPISQEFGNWLSRIFSSLNLTDMQGSAIAIFIPSLALYAATRSLMVSMSVASPLFILFIFIGTLDWWYLLLLLWIPVSLVLRTLKLILTPKEA